MIQWINHQNLEQGIELKQMMNQGEIIIIIIILLNLNRQKEL